METEAAEMQWKNAGLLRKYPFKREQYNDRRMEMQWQFTQKQKPIKQEPIWA